MSWKASFCPLAGQLSGGHAKLKHARGELEAAFHSAGIPHLLQREQDAPGGGTGQPGRGRHRGQRHDRLARLERPDHVEATGKGLDEVRAGVAGAIAPLPLVDGVPGWGTGQPVGGCCAARPVE
jgi:hypothetical protein